MSILATGKKLITLGEAYSAGAGIDITDHVISVTSEGTPYSAGPNIDIQGHVISGKDWTDDIANASANAFSESYNASTAYTDQEIFDTTNNITSVISSVSSTLNTQINEVSASVSSVTDDIVGEINDLSASIDYVSGTLETVSGDITAMIPTDYYTTANPSGFITNVSAETTYQPIGNYASASDITGFATKTELENTSGAITSMIPSTAGLATESDLQIVSAGVDYVSGALTGYQPIGDYATTGQLNTASGILSGAIDYISGVAVTSTAGLATTGQLDTASSFLSVTIDGLSGDIAYVSANAGKTYSGVSPIVVNNDELKISASTFQLSAGDNITFTEEGNIVRIDGQAGGGGSYTGDAQGALDEVYTNSSHWNESYTALTANSGTWTGGGSVDTIPFVVNQPLVTGFTGDSAYIGLDSTAINLSAYVPVSSLTYNGNYLTGVSGKQVSSYYAYSAYTARNAGTASRAYLDRNGNEITSYYQPKLTIDGSDGTITAINNSAIGGTMTAAFELSAGSGISITDDLDASATVISVTAAGGNPEVESYVQTNSASIDDVVSTYETNSASYMTESNLEYNAVNEISGYAGSAIAQYGAEKQWLVHDDTLVHAANSAQYALGCNISALQRLMGIDETVLYSGNSPALNSTFNIAEPFSAFKKISFRCKNIDNAWPTYYDTNTLHSKIAFKGEWAYNWMNKAYYKCDMVTPTSYSYTANTLEILKHTSSAVSAAIQIIQNDNLGNVSGVWTIIGIGRKQ